MITMVDKLTQEFVACRDREVAGLDTVVPLETTAAYDIKDVITGVGSMSTFNFNFMFLVKTNIIQNI